MGTFSIKGGKTFAIKAAMLGLDIDRQLELLNLIYRGKVEFEKGSCRSADEHRFKECICIQWVAEDIDDLELPECEYIAAERLFAVWYEGNVRTLRLPECLKTVRLSDVDEKAGKIENLVIQPGTRYINDEGVAMIVKENEDGSRSEMKLRLYRHPVVID